MSKKSKKFDATAEGSNEQNPATDATGEAKASPFTPKNPALYLVDQFGNQFKFTHFPLPKKAAVKGEITVDGTPVSFQVTSNKGFTTETTVINYSWMTLPSGATGYIAHDYNREPEANIGFTVHEGKTERKDPARVPKDDVVGAQRVEKFKTTMSTRKAAVEPTPA